MNRPTTILQKLGLNALEAEVYLHLLTQEEPVTAYRIGKTLAKPTANVYKAIEALAQKGAVILDLGESCLCRAVAVEEFLTQLESTFRRTTGQAAKHLSNLRSPPPDERIYQLKSVPLVFERFRSMLTGANQIAVVDAFPKAMEIIQPIIDEQVGRGMDIYVVTYESMSDLSAHVVQAYQGDLILKHWNAQQLNCVVDGQEVLLAFMHNDLSDIYQAVWSDSPYLACIMHAGLMREHFFHEIAALKKQDNLPDQLRALIDQHPGFHTRDIPGQKLLFSQAGVDKKGV